MIFFIRLREERGQPRSIAFECGAESVQHLTKLLGTAPAGVWGQRISWRHVDPQNTRSTRIVTRRVDLTLTAARVEQIEEAREPFEEEPDGRRSPS